MADFVEYLAQQRAYYYRTLYRNKPFATSKDECLSRIKMMDEYMLLLNIVGELPIEIKRQVVREYEDLVN